MLALAGYLVILFGFISGIYQWPVLITFATLPVIWKNIQTFKQELPQPKVSVIPLKLNGFQWHLCLRAIN